MDINFEFFSIEPSTIIGVLCNTLILFLIFKKFLFGPVNKIIEERKAQVSKTYDEADRALKKQRTWKANILRSWRAQRKSLPRW